MIDTAFRGLLAHQQFIDAGLTLLYTITSTPCTMATAVGSAVVATLCKVAHHGLVLVSAVNVCDSVRLGPAEAIARVPFSNNVYVINVPLLSSTAQSSVSFLNAR